jgi:hypothetical protein
MYEVFWRLLKKEFLDSDFFLKFIQSFSFLKFNFSNFLNSQFPKNSPQSRPHYKKIYNSLALIPRFASMRGIHDGPINFLPIAIPFSLVK